MNIRNILSLVLCCLLSVALFPTSCLAYQITDSELTELNQNLNNLENIIVTQRNELMLSKNDLVIVRTELVSVQKELLQSRDELKLVQQDLTKANELSLKAEESLTKLKKEGSNSLYAGGGMVSADGKIYPVLALEYSTKGVSYEVIYGQQASGALVKFKIG